MPLAPSTRLGPYQIVAPIGAGAMGEVYRARDPRLDREVALKILTAQSPTDARTERRFEAEARAASALNHPNILTVHDVGSEDGTSYIVSELIYGEPLRKLIRRGPVPLPRLLEIAVQIADGLAAAHQAGIVHRDLKPENIMITQDGRVKLLDFGLAKPPDGGDTDPEQTLGSATEPGLIVGTVSYMSPEQARGGAIDFRSDQFSFGCVLYEMITGERPFGGANPIQTLLAISTEDPQPLANVPAPLRWLVERCLAKNPNHRYGATIDLYRDLGEIRDHLTEALPLKVVRPALNDRLAGVEIAVLVLAALLIGFLASHSLKRRASAGLENLQFAPVTSGAALDAFPAWSPDGRTLAYSGEARGVFQVFTQPSQGGTAAQITHGDTHAVFPFWSFDGRRLYFITASGTQPTLWQVGAAGGKPEVVAGNVAQAAESPDGKVLALLRRDGADYSLWLSRPPGRKAERYTRLKPVARWSWLAFSPDGKRLGVWGNTPDGHAQLWLVPMGGGDPEPALQKAGAATAQRFSWTPDESIVVGGGNHLRSMTLAGTGERAVTVGTGIEMFPAVSPDGKRIAFAAVRFAYHQIRVTIAGGAVARRALDAAGLEWAPSGKQYAFVQGNAIVLRDAETGWERVIVTPSAFPGTTSWIGDLQFSPDGDRIAYTRAGDDGVAVWLSPLAGGQALLMARNARQPSFSPDGLLVYAHSRVGLARGEMATTVTRDGGHQPRWSPAGDQIAYLFEGGVRLVKSDGSERRELAAGHYLAITWSGDGEAVYGLRNGERLEVVKVAVETARAEVVADLGPSPADLVFGWAAGREPVRSFSLSRDGSSIEISILRPESDVWTVAGFAGRGNFLDRYLSPEL